MPISARAFLKAEVPAWSAVVTKWPSSYQPQRPHKTIGIFLNLSKTLTTACVGIQPATHKTIQSNSLSEKYLTALSI